MLGALEGFGVIGCIILAGFLLGRSGVLGSHGQQVLANTVFFVGTPALMFTTIASTPVSQVFTPALFATAGSALLMAVVMRYDCTSSTVIPCGATSEPRAEDQF